MLLLEALETTRQVTSKKKYFISTFLNNKAGYPVCRRNCPDFRHIFYFNFDLFKLTKCSGLKKYIYILERFVSQQQQQLLAQVRALVHEAAHEDESLDVGPLLAGRCAVPEVVSCLSIIALIFSFKPKHSVLLGKRHFYSYIQFRVSEPACFGAAPAPAPADIAFCTFFEVLKYV